MPIFHGTGYYNFPYLPSHFNDEVWSCKIHYRFSLPRSPLILQAGKFFFFNNVHFMYIILVHIFKGCKSVHHRTIQINHQPDATIFQFIILTFIYSSSGVFPPIIRRSVTAVAASDLPSYHQPDATIFQFIILTFIYSSTCFGRFPAHHQEIKDCSGSLWFTFVSW